MAKKKRHRIWWYPMFEMEAAAVKASRILKDEGDGWPLLFDSREQAYAMAAAHRFEVQKDKDGAHVLVDGRAQLINHGRITILGIKGAAIDWKKALAVPLKQPAKGEAISIRNPIQVHEWNYDAIFSEPEDVYKMIVNSNMAKAGGVSDAAVAQGSIAPTEAD